MFLVFQILQGNGADILDVIQKYAFKAGMFMR